MRSMKNDRYCSESDSLTIYCLGVHKFLLTPNTKNYRLQVREAVLRNSSLGTHGIQQIKMGQLSDTVQE